MPIIAGLKSGLKILLKEVWKTSNIQTVFKEGIKK